MGSSSSCTITLVHNLKYETFVCHASSEKRSQAASATTAMPEVGSQHFFKAIQPDTHKNGNIEFPQDYSNKSGKNLPKDAYLQDFDTSVSLDTTKSLEIENPGRQLNLDQPKDQEIPEKSTPKKPAKAVKRNKPCFMDRVRKIFLCGLVW